ncbi:patatin-like phospholipase family protein [Patescibacteria group bacterium]|nr:patatin-like phospholipase family protein [Patescibacteria group bacterium]
MEKLPNGLTVKPEKTAVILCGGGFCGICHACALRVIEQNNIPVDEIIGNSVGAITGAAFLIEDCRADRIFDVFFSLKKPSSIFKFQSALYFIKKLGMPETIYRDDGLLRIIASLDTKKLIEQPKEFIVATTHIPSGKITYFSKNDPEMLEDPINLSLAIKAAASPLGIFPYVILKRHGEYGIYADGGYKRPLPIKKAIDDGCNTIIVVRCQSDRTKESISGILHKRFPHLLVYGFNLLHHSVEKDEISIMRKLYPQTNIIVSEPNWLPPSLSMESFEAGDFQKVTRTFTPNAELTLAPLIEYYKNQLNPPQANPA